MGSEMCIRDRDNIMLSWFTLAADVGKNDLDEVSQKLEDGSINPMGLKRELARKIVTLYHNEDKAIEAENHFNQVTVSKRVPDDIDDYHLEEDDLLVNIIADSGLLNSKSEARRMIKQSAVKIDGETVTDIQHKITTSDSFILKVGKRKFLKVRG